MDDEMTDGTIQACAITGTRIARDVAEALLGLPVSPGGHRVALSAAGAALIVTAHYFDKPPGSVPDEVTPDLARLARLALGAFLHARAGGMPSDQQDTASTTTSTTEGN